MYHRKQLNRSVTVAPGEADPERRVGVGGRQGGQMNGTNYGEYEHLQHRLFITFIDLLDAIRKAENLSDINIAAGMAWQEIADVDLVLLSKGSLSASPSSLGELVDLSAHRPNELGEVVDGAL